MTETEPSWELYATFLAVMQEGTLSGAADRLGVAHPTVRRRVEALEDSLETSLFIRTPNGVMPTERARAVLPYAESMAATARSLVRSASGSRGAEHGTVRITASEVVGVEVLPPILNELRDAYPDIDVELSVSDRNEDILRRDADIAVRMAKPSTPSLIARRIGVIPVGFFCTADYLGARDAPTTLDDLRDHDLIGYDRDTRLVEGLAAAGLDVSHADFVFRTNSDLAYLAALRSGIGIGACQVPLGVASSLVRILPDVEFDLEAWIVVHQDLRDVRRVRVVLDHLAGAMQRYVESS